MGEKLRAFHIKLTVLFVRFWILVIASLICALIFMTFFVAVCTIFSLHPPYPWVALGSLIAAAFVQLFVDKTQKSYLKKLKNALKTDDAISTTPPNGI